MTQIAAPAPQPTTQLVHSAAGAARFLWTHRWFLLVALVLASLGAWQALRYLYGPSAVADRVMRATIVETVVATGNVLTPHRVNISSQITGTVKQVLVDDGEKVTKGQPLIALEDAELIAATVSAQGSLAQAEARMRQLKELTLPTAQETRKQMQANLIDAQKAFDRATTLLKSGSGTQVALDDARKGLDVARSQANAAQLAIYTSSPDGSDFVMAETQLHQAHANLQTAEARLGYATIKAPSDGVLIARSVERGAVVVPGTTLLVHAPAGKLQLELQIDERNLGKLALGQKAVASADAYAGQTFDAVVSYINPGVDIARASVQVKLDVQNAPAYLRQDMTVSVDIEDARRENALVLPTRAINGALSGAPWVLSERNGHAYKQPVKLGLRGQTQVEIAEGLSEGAWALPAGSGVRVGQRVRPFTP